jgi:hypothetical protein
MWFVVKGGWPQMILLFLIMRCTPTIRELIEATPLSPSSPSATSLSALAPAQRAGGVLGMLSSLEVKVLYPT